MSRLKQFTRSMISGYAHLGLNVLYTLASVPLALKYLSKAEFGLWALVLQISNYIALVDMGMSSSVARILIDHKDDRTNGRYGGALKSGALVGLAQGAMILVVGLVLLKLLAIVFRVPNELGHSFYWLMAGQVLLTAAMFGTRIIGQMLYAWQRIDVTNYSGMAQLVVGFAALWISFLMGAGIFSLLIGAAIGWVCGMALNVWASCALRLWPKKGEWGAASKDQFKELFNYGAEVFLIGLGTQLIASSQTMLVSRQLGMEAAALWSVMTKVFTLVTQVVWKIVGNAMPAFAEMQVRGEWSRLWERYRQLFLGTNAFAAFCSILFASCNRLFVIVWTHGKFSWSPANDILLAVWMILLTQQCCHNSLVMTLKEIKTLKYVFLIEGMVFIGISLPLLPATGISGMLACSVAATGIFTWLTGLWRIARLSRMGWKPLLWDWQKPLFIILLAMIPCWLVIDFLLRDSGDLARLLLNGVLLAIVGAWITVRYALPSDLVREIGDKMPAPLQPLIRAVSGAACRQRQKPH